MPLLLLTPAAGPGSLPPVSLLGWVASQPEYHNYEALTSFVQAQARAGLLHASPDVFAAALQTFMATVEVVPWLR